MWLSDRRTFLVGLAAVAGCGYQPAAAPGSAGATLFSGQLQVAAPQDQNQYSFVEEAESRLGPPRRNPKYLLNYTITTDDVPIGTTPNQVVTRYNVIGKIDWTLTAADGGGVLTSGGFQSFSSYADTGTPVSGLSARDDAYKRLMVLMADQIIDKLVATAPIWRDGQAPQPQAVPAAPQGALVEPHVSVEPL